ncbi:unknown [Neodiprion lecontei nucleopolyhedrovirus]|uniref:Uncharacterized protein n=1 Tax=Neodiprion lecontei nucleopolyhedrovirus (strain Canada) TaxID=654906 RepID=Q6JPE8_NPVNC|nr:unknown [Neodiprion lecontei nucleopolyhedrovirus]AAQ99066.1 unknown [Neodiprion lecontei nucleopolyhedrovirus]
MTNYYGVIVNKYTFRNLVQKITELTEENVRLRENNGDYLKAQRIINIALNQQHIDVNSNLTDLVTKLITTKNTDYRSCQKCDVRAISDNVVVENVKQISECKALLSSLQTEAFNTTANLNKYAEIMNNFHSRIIRLINDKILGSNVTDGVLLRDDFIKDIIDEIVILFDAHLNDMNRINTSTDTNLLIQKHTNFITNLKDLLKRIYGIIISTKQCDQLLQVFLNYLTGYEKFKNLNKNKFRVMNDSVMRDLAFEIQRLCSEEQDSINMYDDFYGNDQYNSNETLLEVIIGNRDHDAMQATLAFRTLNQSLQQKLLNTNNTNTYDLIKEFLFMYDTSFSDYKSLQMENLESKKIITDNYADLSRENSELKSLLREQTIDANSCTSTIKETYELLKNINDIIDDESVPILSFTNTNISTMTISYDDDNITTLISVTRFVQNKLSIFRNKFNEYFNISKSYNLNTSLNIIQTARRDNVIVIEEQRKNDWTRFCETIDCGDLRDNIGVVDDYISVTKRISDEFVEQNNKITEYYNNLTQKLMKIPNKKIDVMHELVISDINETSALLRKHNISDNHLLQMIKKYVSDTDMTISDYEEYFENTKQAMQTLRKESNDIKNDRDAELKIMNESSEKEIEKLQLEIKELHLEIEKNRHIIEDQMEREAKYVQFAALNQQADSDKNALISIKSEPRVRNETSAIKTEPRVPTKRPNVFMSENEKPVAKRSTKISKPM